MTFSVWYDDNNQEFLIRGTMKPQTPDELLECRATFEKSVQLVKGTLYVNVRKLAGLNNLAFRELTAVLRKVAHERPDLKITIIWSGAMGGSVRKFGLLARISPNITLERRDKEFYPAQEVMEDDGFIPVLRTQTKMTWRHERDILPRHGLKEGLSVADICCGIGDFAVLLHKEFKPARLVALGQSQAKLVYARKVAADFGIDGIDYVHGDGTQTLLADSRFDFVTCRHALQTFSRPEPVLRELFRICKPGGRVYITNEKNSHCLGEPRGESIQWTYNEVARLWSHYGMDVELGPKNRGYLIDAGFEDVLMESFMVTNLDGDPQDFADIIRSWEDIFAGRMAAERGDSDEFIEKFRQGFQDHIFAALHPRGYAGWPIWVASGRKPL